MSLTYELLPARRFTDIKAEPPDFAHLEAEYDAMERSLENAQDAAQARAVMERWEHVRRAFATWSALAELNFQRDTKNDEFKRANDLNTELRPKITGLDVALKRKLLASPLRKAIESESGAYLFERWELDVTAFDPGIEAQTVRESQTADEYIKLMAEASFEFNGEQLNLSTVSKYGENPNRDLRRGAYEARWNFMQSNAPELDRLYDDLVHLRDEMARTLEFRSFTELGYRRMVRTGYGPAEVARYREEIVREIVPLAQRIREQQARDLGIDRVMYWDEGLYATGPAPAPPQDYAEIMQRARNAFNGIHSDVGAFAGLMMDGGLLDMTSRDAKANGGFCTSFPQYGLPFIFANFNGSTHDVNVLVHEMGHAFQCYSSRGLPVSEYLWPTYEACEVHSMSMEFFAWPQLDQFFGADAERYRRQHLKSSICSLPYIAAVDHFQHWVYDNPGASPKERNAFWKQMEATYMPWRRYGGIPRLEEGGMWQAQRHIYAFPFYYIDYGLAMCCALQFWSWSLDDYRGALDSYVKLCARGGVAPFGELIREAGLKSPFEAGVLSMVASRASQMLELA